MLSAADGRVAAAAASCRCDGRGGRQRPVGGRRVGRPVDRGGRFGPAPPSISARLEELVGVAQPVLRLSPPRPALVLDPPPFGKDGYSVRRRRGVRIIRRDPTHVPALLLLGSLDLLPRSIRPRQPAPLVLLEILVALTHERAARLPAGRTRSVLAAVPLGMRGNARLFLVFRVKVG